MRAKMQDKFERSTNLDDILCKTTMSDTQIGEHIIPAGTTMEKYGTLLTIYTSIVQHKKITRELKQYKKELIQWLKEDEKKKVDAGYYGQKPGTGKRRGRPPKNKQETHGELTNPVKTGSSIYRPAGANFRIKLKNPRSTPGKQRGRPKSQPDPQPGGDRKSDLDGPALSADASGRTPGTPVGDRERPPGTS
jgi:hypothetical protein